MEVIICTSLTLAEWKIKDQKKAISSWLEFNNHPVSFNHPSEIEILKKIFKDILFVPIINTAYKKYKKHLIYIDSFLNWLSYRPEQTFAIVNSDIIFNGTSSTMELIEDHSKDSFIWAHRYDFNKDMIDSKLYYNGMDAFFLNKECLSQYKKSKFILGKPYWDWWIVYVPMLNGHQIYKIMQEFAYHRSHLQQWGAKELQQYSLFFLKYFNISFKEQTSRVAANKIHQIIVDKSKFLEIPSQFYPDPIHHYNHIYNLPYKNYYLPFELKSVNYSDISAKKTKIKKNKSIQIKGLWG